jgi:hypothetical protein
MHVRRLENFFPALFGRWAFRLLARGEEAAPDDPGDVLQLERIRDEERLAQARLRLQVSVGAWLT